MESSNSKWLMMVLDSSRIATVVVSVCLIIYGSFRALKLDSSSATDDDANETETKKSSFFFASLSSDFHTISTTQAIFLPLWASCSLLFMFFFFERFQSLFALFTVVLGTMAFSLLLLPMCQSLLRPITNPDATLLCGCCGRFTQAELLSLVLSLVLIFIWVSTGHWILMDALAMCLCISMISYLRLPSLKVSVLLLLGLVVYDVFWVYFSAYFFKDNVMVKVATQPAVNPVSFVADKLISSSSENIFPSNKLSLPGKLVFPSYSEKGRVSMLGLGDIVMPGLLLTFVLRFDNHKRQTAPVYATESRIKYFHCSLIGYFVGLVTATVVSEVYETAQPALLFLVPSTLLPLLVIGYLNGDLKEMWSNPFTTISTKMKQIEI